MWHPQHGEIAGLTVAEWQARSSSRRRPSRSIVFATDERSGSEYLCNLAARTGKLGVPCEYLNTGWMRRFVADYPDAVADQVEVAHTVGTTSNGVFSIKLHTSHFDRLNTALRIEDCCPQPLFVRLTRDDMLLQAISLMKARQSMSYHSHVPLENMPYYDSDLIESILASLENNNRRWNRYFLRNDIRPLRVTYEELSHSPGDVVQKIANLIQTSIDIRDCMDSGALIIQRDDESLSWRERFVAEKRDINLFEM